MRVSLVVLTTAVVALCGACRTLVEVEVIQQATGGGTVRVQVDLDAGAAEAVGGAEAFVVDDLQGTRWSVAEPTEAGDGGLQLVATAGFSGAAELQEVLDELAGAGVFSGVVSTVRHEFARSEAELSVDVSVTGELSQFSDDALTEVLGGLPLGYTAEELAFMGAEEPGAADMTVRVEAVGGDPDEVTLGLNSGEPRKATVASANSDRDDGVLLLGGLGVLATLIGMVVLVVALVRRRHA